MELIEAIVSGIVMMMMAVCGRTKREFFRHETTSDGSEVASCWWVVVAEAS
jgi:hypothetical protein